MAEKKMELAPSKRFSDLVMREYNSMANVGANMTDTQKRLVQNYFIVTDRVLQGAEQRRLAKSEKYRDPVPVTWQNIDMTALALDCAYHSRLGLDPMQKNHLHVIPYKNNKTGKYDINFMPGYSGMELIALKYAAEKPLDVTCELVYSNDAFTIHKKSATNKVESYDLEIKNPFDRGNVVGGFGYIQYEQPEKNKLIVLSIKDIEKRKGSGQGNAEFWGGEKDKWENGKKVGKEHVEGWYEEMCLKTVKRAIFGGSHIPIDPAKIDEAYEYVKRREVEQEQAFTEQEIALNANTGPVIDAEYFDVADPPAVDSETGEVVEESAPDEQTDAAKPGF